MHASQPIVRDVLGRAQSAREVRFIVHNELIKVDGRVCKDTVVALVSWTFSLGDEHFRCMLDANGRLRYVKISAEEALETVRVEGKTTLKGGKTQLNFHDGRNMLVDDAKEFNTGDSIKLSLPDQEVLEHIKLKTVSMLPHRWYTRW